MLHPDTGCSPAHSVRPYLGDNLILLLSPPRSGSTLLQQMLGAHPQIHTHPEPHLLTPLAFQGYFYQVERAPYNHRTAARALRNFVAALPDGEEDYLDACRAYCGFLYTRMLHGTGKRYFLDKTPNYADTILPFVHRLLPRARYIVLTRHPLAVLSSNARTFFDGDYDRAHYSRKLLEEFVPPIAEFLRDPAVASLHVRYETLVTDPESTLAGIFEHLRLGYEPECLNYGRRPQARAEIGDPNVYNHERPVTNSLRRWVDDLLEDPAREALCRRVIARLSPADLETFGYSPTTLWQPLEEAKRRGVRRHVVPARIPRRLAWSTLWALKRVVRTTPLGRAVRSVSHACEVLLR